MAEDRMKKLLTVVALCASTVLLSQAPLPKDWVDGATGHRIVRLTGDAGGSTLYFHDNAFSPEGNTLMFNTPSGIAIVDVAKIGSEGLEPQIVAPAVRGGYFSRRTREIYYGSPGGAVTALHIDAA
jgi:oligogalacturonide lyase